MRSRAHIKTHPLHPILIPFPIAFFTGTLAFDLLAIILEKEAFEITAFYLLIAGIITALAAAIPGFIDFLYTVPPNSSAKKRASTHGVLNLCMVALFSLALIARAGHHQLSGWVLILEGLGFIVMNIAGWLGGTLVHRNQIGVDPRYAFAGKWKEEYLTENAGRVALGKCEDLKRDQMKLVHVSGRRIVIARTENGIVAFGDSCTHKGGSLAGGMMICGTVQCPWHGSQFDVVNGGVKAGPAKKKIATYEIQTIDDALFLNLKN